MIKNYLALSPVETEKVYDYFNTIGKKYNKLEDMDKNLRSDLFGFGEGIIFNFQDNNIVGSIEIILKDCPLKAIAYAISINISPDYSESTNIIVEQLIKASKELAKKHNANELYLGTNNGDLITALNSLSYFKQYSALKMVLHSRNIELPILELIPLCEENKKLFLDIDNEAFSDVPHGATVYEYEIDEYIRKADDNNCYFIAALNGQEIGFLLFEIKDGMAVFDLGLKKNFRGKGYGKMLLETAIDFLNKKKVEEIGLIVITKNTLAYNMYIKRGFIEQKIISQWFQII